MEPCADNRSYNGGASQEDEEFVKGSFKLFCISKSSRKILKSRGISHLFPIQYRTFNGIYERKDVIGQARQC